MPFSDSIDLLTLTAPANKSVGITTLGLTNGTLFDVSLREQLIAQFVRANNVAGNSVFSIDGSNDGVNWTTSLACQDLQSVNATTFSTTKTITGNGNAAFKISGGWRYIRGVVNQSVDGTSYILLEAS